MKLLNKIYMTLVFIFLYAPIFVLIVFSFNNSKRLNHEIIIPTTFVRYTLRNRMQ